MEQFTCEEEGEVLILHMPEEIDDHWVRIIRDGMERCLHESDVQTVIFDFGETKFMDSAGIGMLIGRYKRMKSRGGVIWIRNVNGQIRRLLKIAGMEQMLPEWQE